MERLFAVPEPGQSGARAVSEAAAVCSAAHSPIERRRSRRNAAVTPGLVTPAAAQ